MSRVEVALEDVVERLQDGPFGSNLKSAHYADKGIRVVRLQNVGIGAFKDEDKAYIAPEHFAKLKKHECLPGDILVSTLGDPILRAAILPDSVPVALNKADCIQVRCDPSKVVPRYLVHYLNSKRAQSQAKAHAHGQTRPRVNLTQLRQFLIPLPPIEEQERIAAVLDAADALRAKRRQARAKLNTLTQAIFIDAFGDPVANTRNWPRRPFAELCSTTLGKMLDKKQQTGLQSRWYLRNANVRWFGFDLDDVEEMDFDATARQKYRLQIGDVLICEGGEPGRAAVWRGELQECYFQKALHRGRPDPELATSDFIVHLLYHLAATGGLVDHISTATIAHLTGRRLKEMQVIAPPLSAQEEFSRRLAAAEGQKRTAGTSESGLSALFASLQQRAFRGEL